MMMYSSGDKNLPGWDKVRQLKLTVTKPPSKPSPIVKAKLRRPGSWFRAVFQAKGSIMLSKVDKETFNEKFRKCPVVRYQRDGVDAMVYTQVMPIPDGFDAWEQFTQHFSYLQASKNDDPKKQKKVVCDRSRGRLHCKNRNDEHDAHWGTKQNYKIFRTVKALEDST